MRQLMALARAAVRQLVGGLRLATIEAAQWRARAASIPDQTLRVDALSAIDEKRTNIHGAALFWTLPHGRSNALLRLLVAYEVMADYIDCADEHMAKGPLLQLALGDAFEQAAIQRDYYQAHPCRQDCGYLQALLTVCRTSCVRLPSFQVIAPHLNRAARLTEVQALNHFPGASARESALRAWAANHDIGSDAELYWFERAAAASAWLTVLALLAFAFDPARSTRDAAKLYAAYLPWISLTATMLDSYGDAAQDNLAGDHSYIAHYQTTDLAHRLSAIVARSTAEAGALRDGARHCVIAITMTAMYLSKDSVRLRPTQNTTHMIAQAGGPLMMLLLPVLRAWRLYYGQRAA